MDLFLININSPFNELERQILSTGRALFDIEYIFKCIIEVKNARTHIINICYSLIIVLKRMKKLLCDNDFCEILSCDFLPDLLKSGEKIPLKIRKNLVADLRTLYVIITKIISTDDFGDKISNLRDLVKPEFIIYGKDGYYEKNLVEIFSASGFRNLGVTILNNMYYFSIEATDTEEKFTYKVILECKKKGLTKIPKFIFTYHPGGALIED